MRSAYRWIIFGGLGSLSLGQAIILSSFGPIARDFGMTEYSIGLIISISAIVAVVAAPWWGKRSDAIGHRRIFLMAMLGNFITTTGFVVLLWAGQGDLLLGLAIFIALLFMRMTYAFIASAGMPAACGIIAAETPKEKRAQAMSLTGTAFSFGSLSGAVLTYLIAGEMGPFAPLWAACAIIGFVAVLALPFGWHRATGRMDVAQKESQPAQKQSWKTFWQPLLIGVAAYTSMGMVQQLMPFFAQDAFSLDTGGAVQTAGLLTTVGAVSTLVVLQITARVSISSYLLVSLGGATAAGAVSLYLVSPSLELLVFAHILMGAGFGFLLPGLQATVSLKAQEDQQAVASGYLASATTSGYVIGPVLGGAIYAVSTDAAFVAALGLILLATMVSFLGKK